RRSASDVVTKQAEGYAWMQLSAIRQNLKEVTKERSARCLNLLFQQCRCGAQNSAAQQINDDCWLQPR
ncbi:MAG: hypothetical protein ACRDAM_18035, partial [Casimicrobium sp.]